MVRSQIPTQRHAIHLTNPGLSFTAYINSQWRWQALLLPALHMRRRYGEYQKSVQRLPGHHSANAFTAIRTFIGESAPGANVWSCRITVNPVSAFQQINNCIQPEKNTLTRTNRFTHIHTYTSTSPHTPTHTPTNRKVVQTETNKPCKKPATEKNQQKKLQKHCCHCRRVYTLYYYI